MSLINHMLIERRKINIMQYNNIYNCDILDIKLDNVVDLITSPPYNLSIDYDDNNDSLDFDDYILFVKKWALICYEALKDDGRFCLNIPMKITQPHNKKLNISLSTEYINVFKEIGFGFNNMVIWHKGNINKTCWGSFKSASSPFVRDPAECIILFYKNQWAKKNKKGLNDITNEEFVKWTQNVWTFPSEKRKNNKHPAPFPLELPTRCIKLFSYIDDLVMDPFNGSGTTTLAAKQLNRRYIGIEKSKLYYEQSLERINTN
jgi:site-specific DNA-methyltransferase (adenine-specific)